MPPCALLAQASSTPGEFVKEWIQPVVLILWMIYLTIEISRMRRSGKREEQAPINEDIHDLQQALERHKTQTLQEIAKIYDDMKRYAEKTASTLHTVFQELGKTSGQLEVLAINKGAKPR